MEIVHISAECFPVAKVGGLADVVGALPKYQNRAGHLAKVVIPNYANKYRKETEFETVYKNIISLGSLKFPYEIVREKKSNPDFELYLIDIPGLFDRPEIYAYKDDTERFVAFQIAFLDWLNNSKVQPDIIHCHDHHTGLIPFMVKFCPDYKKLKSAKTVLTIHNAQYQGEFPFEKIKYLPEFPITKSGFLEWNGLINPLASAIKCANLITTVSPTYLLEMRHAANGLESLLDFEKEKSVGILNGIDTEVWNPETDPLLENNFSIKTLKSGRSKNKKHLCKAYNLDDSKPLFAFIGRLVGEKGADLLPHICSLAFQTHGADINIFILGSGDKTVESSLIGMRNFYHGNYNVHIGYDEKLAHAVYGSADFLLMPSRVEPCGLNQMYALRYGTVPIVRRTGGLKDTVLDIGDGGFGICHDQASVADVLHSINRAIDLFSDNKQFDSVRKTAMKIDHSWEQVANKYTLAYESINQKRNEK